MDGEAKLKALPLKAEVVGFALGSGSQTASPPADPGLDRDRRDVTSALPEGMRSLGHRDGTQGCPSPAHPSVRLSFWGETLLVTVSMEITDPCSS